MQFDVYLITDLNISSKYFKNFNYENGKTFNSITVDSIRQVIRVYLYTNQLKNEINSFTDKFLHNFKKCVSNIMLICKTDCN